MCGKAALVLCFAAVVIWTSDILDDEFHDETASHQLQAVKEEQDVPRSSSIGFLRRLSLPGRNSALALPPPAPNSALALPPPVLWTPLHSAASDGDVSEVKELLAKGAEVDAKDKNGETPLHYAAQDGRLDVVKVLLAKGAEVNAKDKDGSTPLHLAAEHGHLDVVKVLLSNGAEVTSFTYWNGGEHVVKQVIKLAQHSSKPEESSETLIILTDLLRVQCLPEVAQWAVNHSYAIDAFPAEDSTARSCVLQYMSPEARARLAAESWWSYVTPIVGVAIAAVSAYMVEPLILHHFGSVDAPNHKETHKFYHGAHLLVAKAAISGYWPKMAFRFFEVITIIGFFMGFAMVELWWVWWLPFVGLLFLLPGIKLHGTKELMRTPVKCIASTNTERGYMWSFLRVVMILAAFVTVGATTGWHRRKASPWDFSSLKMDIFVNPMYEGLQNKIKYMWGEATLAPLLDCITYFATLGSKNSINEIDIPWLNGQVKWLAHTSTLQIFQLGYLFLSVSFSLYLGGLLVRRWQRQNCIVDGDVIDISFASYAKQLAENPAEEVPRLIEEIKKKERKEWKERKKLKVGKKDLVLQVEPIGKCSLIKMLMFVALDVFFDVNTIITLILSSNLRFACALTFVVARSTFREWNNFSGLKEAVWESYERGMLHEQLIDLLEEEKGAEAFFSLSITSYSYVYCVQTAEQAMAQWCSILLAPYGIAEFLVQKMEFPTTEKVNSFVSETESESESESSFVIGPSEEILK